LKAPLAKAGAFLFILYFYFFITHTPLPCERSPVILYANQSGDDLKKVILSALSHTTSSLFLQIYGCTESAVIHSIQHAQKKGICTSIFYDPSGSGSLNKKIKGAIPLHRRGLMHKKILVTDQEKVFIGSTNLTPTSLCMHDNTILGFHSKELAYDILHSLAQHTSYSIGSQKIDLWHLPDHKHACIKKVLELISSAKKTIRIAMFTFTHPDILKSLEQAQKEGVEVKVALDYSSSIGASATTVQFLQEKKIPFYIGAKGKLLHHKWCLIDETTLILGSANWTKSAFKINEDCLLVVSDLTKKQKKQFQRIWSKIEKTSSKKENLTQR